MSDWLDPDNFEFDEEWVREAARLEEEAGCDISAGFPSFLAARMVVLRRDLQESTTAGEEQVNEATN